MIKWLYLIAGSIVGGALRYLVGHSIYDRFGTAFPYGTLVVNSTGCLFIGLFSALAFEKLRLGPNERVLLITGFCGAYTTFSALILESSLLLDSGKVWLAGLNILVSLVLGFAFFRLGSLAARAF